MYQCQFQVVQAANKAMQQFASDLAKQEHKQVINTYTWVYNEVLDYMHNVYNVYRKTT